MTHTFSCCPEGLDGPADLLELVGKVASLPEGLRAPVIAGLLEVGIVLAGCLSELRGREGAQYKRGMCLEVCACEGVAHLHEVLTSYLTHETNSS